MILSLFFKSANELTSKSVLEKFSLQELRKKNRYSNNRR